jgi:acyl-CoA dehydrogenase
MTWILDEQRQMLADSARDFFAGRAPVSQLRALRDGNDARGYSPGLWRAFAEQGYSSVLVDEAHGGLGLGVCEAGLIAEQIGRTLAATPWFGSAVLAARLLQRHGSAAQRQAWLPRIAGAQTVLALALEETPRHRGARVEHTTATEDAEGWRLDGRKQFVVDGHVAEALIVAAKRQDGVVLLLVPADAAGVQIERTTMLDSHNAARVVFSGLRLPAQAEIAGGAAALEALLDVGRAVAAAELLGLADEVFARTLDYLKQRRQFGKAIGEFQALQHRAAELWCDLELTRAIVRQALQAIDAEDAAAPLLAAQAKARACLSANRAVQEGVQMHGGIGMTDELEIGFFMKRARVLQELFGDAAFQLDRAAKLSGY